MKTKVKIIFCCLLIQLLNTNIGYSQGCIEIDSVSIFPKFPTAFDSIFLATKVTIPKIGEFLGFTTQEEDSIINVQGCYAMGPLQSPQTFWDTINLGLRANGIYNLKFVAIKSFVFTDCIYAESDTSYFDFSVGTVGYERTPQEKFNWEIYPNPVSKHYLTISSNPVLEKFEIFNSHGKFELGTENITSNKVEINLESLPPGIYFLRVTSKEKMVRTKQFIKE